MIKIGNVAEKLGTEFSLIYAKALTPLCGVIILFSPLNWAMEALKWQLLALKIEKTSFGSAFKGVIAGLSLGFVTPHNVGDYAGRIWQMKNDNRFQAIGSILLSHAGQFLVTCLMGLLGWAIYYANGILTIDNMNGLLFSLMLLLIICSIIILFVPDFLVKLVNMLPFLVRFENYVKISRSYNSQERLTILVISMLRYLVFSLQFILLINLLKVDLPMPLLFAGITLVFFTKSVVPTFNFLSDLGLREVSALYFLGMLPIAEPKILAASLCLWIINILMPATLGTIFILTLKILK